MFQLLLTPKRRLDFVGNHKTLSLSPHVEFKSVMHHYNTFELAFSIMLQDALFIVGVLAILWVLHFRVRYIDLTKRSVQLPSLKRRHICRSHWKLLPLACNCLQTGNKLSLCLIAVVSFKFASTIEIIVTIEKKQIIPEDSFL